MTYDELIENPAPLMGKRIDRKDTKVIIKDMHTREVWLELEFDAIDEAKTADCHLTQAKFAYGLKQPQTERRQWFASGEGQKRVSNCTGWVK